jgi:hypothetical protein
VRLEQTSSVDKPGFCLLSFTVLPSKVQSLYLSLQVCLFWRSVLVQSGYSGRLRLLEYGPWPDRRRPRCLLTSCHFPESAFPAVKDDEASRKLNGEDKLTHDHRQGVDATPQPRLEEGGDTTTHLHGKAAEPEERPARQHSHCRNPYAFRAKPALEASCP